MTYDASDRKDVRRAEKAARSIESARIAYVRHIMSDSAGREWMQGLLAECSVFHSPFVAGNPDRTAFNCGRQSIGHQTFADVVTHCPDQYVLMMKEQATKENTNVRHDSNADTSWDRDTTGIGDVSVDDPTGGTDSGRNAQGPEPDPANYVDENGWIKGSTR